MMLVLLGAALLSLVAAEGADPPYALSFPAVIRSNESSKACVHFGNVKETLKLEVNLENSGENITIFNEQIPTGEFFKCASFQVPHVKASVPVFIILTALGQSVRIHKRQSVVIAGAGDIHMIQLDRPLYQPGDNVTFRVISVNNAFRPVKAKCTSVHLLDPSSNKMFQLLDVVSEHGILQLWFPLLRGAELGNYRVVALMESGEEISQNVPVDRHVLPRFKVSIDTVSVITILDQTLKYNMSGRYTYNRGVPGNVTSRLCRGYSSYYPGNSCNRHPDGICQTLTGQTDSEGAFSGTFDLATYQFDRPGLQMQLDMQVTLTELGTGVQRTESKYISITREMAAANFNRQAMQHYYKPSLPYHVVVGVTDAAGQPLRNATVELLVGGKNIKNLTTEEDGSAKCELDTSDFMDSSITLQIIYKKNEQCYDSNWLIPTYANDYFTITRFYAWSRSYIQATAPREEMSCGKSYDLKVQYALSKEGVGENTRASVSYLIMSKAAIVQHGQHALNLSQSLRGECSINVSVSSDLAGGADVVVYVMLNNETITDTTRMTVEKCFKHKVSMNFDTQEAIPGSVVNLTVSADPGSLCGLLVKDSSLSLLKQQNQDFTPDTVFDSLAYRFLNGYFVEGFNVAPPPPPCIDPTKRLLINGLYYQPVSAGNEGDSYSMISSVGLLMVTNTSMHKPEVCRSHHIATLFSEAPSSPREIAFTVDSAPPSASSVVTERKTFPAVWIYGLTGIGANGTVTLPETVPGTITAWHLTGFCLSKDKGIGMTKRSSNLTSYLPFFVESSSPQYMVRNETLIFRAFISNNLKSCMKVGIKLGDSENFSAEMIEGQQDMCICQNKRGAYAWNMQPLKLGPMPINVTAWTKSFSLTCDGANDDSQPFRQDSIIPTLIVEAEGQENEMTHSTLVILTGPAVQIPVNITPPSNVVEGSLESTLIITGDILSIPAGNLQSMFRMPTGCGEQRLAILMPIASTMKYLQCKGLLTDAMKAQAISYMETGYRGLLPYIRSDGSSSVFGGSTSPSSTWLTAQMFSTFEMIKQHVFVDPAIQNRALLFLERAQDLKSGCFKAQGVIFNHNLQGGAGDSISLTAFIVFALTRSNYPGQLTLLRNGLTCMDDASRTNQSLYNQAVMAHAFIFAGNAERSNALLEKLMQDAKVDEDGTIHWEQSEKRQPKNVLFFYPRAPPADIQITSYMLWTMASHPDPSQANLTTMSNVARWLVKQMNADGSFRSTADTVVAMEALSAYGCLVQTENATQQVTLSSSNGVNATFIIDKSNRHLIQKLPLDKNEQQYNIEVQGNGSCFIQVKNRFNTQVSKENSDFTLSLNTNSSDCDNGVAYLYTITGSGSYHGAGNKSNMAIIEIKITSGYIPEDSSIGQLKKIFNKVEIVRNRVILYMESASSEPRNFTLTVQMTDTVLNFQPQPCSMYDYYAPDKIAMAVLYHPCDPKKPKEA